MKQLLEEVVEFMETFQFAFDRWCIRCQTRHLPKDGHPDCPTQRTIDRLKLMIDTLLPSTSWGDAMLVYADSLEEEGDERAHALRHLFSGDYLEELHQRMVELAAENAADNAPPEWEEEFPGTFPLNLEEYNAALGGSWVPYPAGTEEPHPVQTEIRTEKARVAEARIAELETRVAELESRRYSHEALRILCDMVKVLGQGRTALVCEEMPFWWNEQL